MRRILNALFGGRRQIFTSYQDGGLSLDTRDPVAMVEEWNLLKSRLVHMEQNNVISTLDEQATISKKLKMVEQACVAYHASPPRTQSFQQLAAQYEGRYLGNALRRCEQDSVDVLKVRIAQIVNEDNKFIAEQFVQKCDAALAALPDEPASDTRRTVSDVIWYLVAGYYEDAVVRSLGSPRNIYVGINVRELFAGTRYSYFVRQGIESTRDDVVKWTSAFAELIAVLSREISENDHKALAQYIRTVSTQGVAGGLSEHMSEAVASTFCEFAKVQPPVGKVLLID